MQKQQDYVLQVEGVSKRFPGVLALDKVQLNLRYGEVLGLIGENGAGKSTLMNTLLGAFAPDAGTMILKGKPYAPKSPAEALNSGISMIHQEISLIAGMTVAENIWIGREDKFSKFGILQVNQRLKATYDLLEKYNIQLDPKVEVGSLSIANMQLVEIVRAISYQSDVIIMDEPTSALTQTEIDALYHIIRTLSKDGTGIIFISHKLEELFDVCHRVTVMRDGQYVDTKRCDEITQDQLVHMMVGREIVDMYPKQIVPIGKPMLEVDNICRRGAFKDVSFTVHAGEILGFCGLVGAGRSEIMEAIFGIVPADSGEIRLDGKVIKNRYTRDAIKNGIAMVTEDRLRRGAIHMLPVRVNMSIAYLNSICKMNFIDRKREVEDCMDMVDKMGIKISSLDQEIASLSGGNQQKVIMGKWLLTGPQVLILDEPTRGIDVGAKAEIYKLIGRLAGLGKAIIVVSSELPELMGISDRILVVHEGRLVAESVRGDFSQHGLMQHAFGVEDNKQEECAI